MQPDFSWTPTHEGDRAILNRMSSKLDPRTGAMHAPSETPFPESGDTGPAGAEDPATEAEQNERVRQCLQNLSEDQRYAVEVVFFGRKNDRELPEQELRTLWDLALNIPKKKRILDSE